MTTGDPWIYRKFEKLETWKSVETVRATVRAEAAIAAAYQTRSADAEAVARTKSRAGDP